MKDVTTEARALFDTYLSCWNDRNFEGIVQCFEEPATFVMPNGTFCLPDHQSLIALLKKVFADLEKENFSHSTVDEVNAKSCGNGLAVLDASGVKRLKHDGSLLEQIDGHYIIRKTEGGWQFSVAVVCQSGWQNT